METITIVYTGAPEAADYDTATTLEIFELVHPWGGASRTWRAVRIQGTAYRTAYQCDRYRSFLGGCPTLDDPRTTPLGEGRPAPTMTMSC